MSKIGKEVNGSIKKFGADAGKIGSLEITVASGSSEQLSSALDFLNAELNPDGLVEVFIDAEDDAGAGDLTLEYQIEQTNNATPGATYKPLTSAVVDMTRTAVSGYVQGLQQIRLSGNGTGAVKVLASFAANTSAARTIHLSFFRI